MCHNYASAAGRSGVLHGITINNPNNYYVHANSRATEVEQVAAAAEASVRKALDARASSLLTDLYWDLAEAQRAVRKVEAKINAVKASMIDGTYTPPD